MHEIVHNYIAQQSIDSVRLLSRISSKTINLSLHYIFVVAIDTSRFPLLYFGPISVILSFHKDINNG